MLYLSPSHWEGNIVWLATQTSSNDGYYNLLLFFTKKIGCCAYTYIHAVWFVEPDCKPTAVQGLVMTKIMNDSYTLTLVKKL